MFMMKPEQFVGQQLGSYRLTEFLKGGGFGFVYKAEHINLQKNVAVKLLRPEHILKEEYVAAFEREAKIIASFTHPHILDVHHYEVFHGIPFLAMPFIEQGSLRTLHPRHSIVETSTIISYVKQIAAALQYAHDHKFVHRDVKPDNFLRGPQGVLLSDFGITITAHSLDSLSLQDRAGTLVYMAPEQFDRKAQVWSDQYSLAVVVYEWLCGKLPFLSESIFEIERKHKQEDPPPLKQQGVDVLPSIESVVRKGLAKKPEERYETVTEFANALEKAALALVSRVDLAKGFALQSEAVQKVIAKSSEAEKKDVKKQSGDEKPTIEEIYIDNNRFKRIVHRSMVNKVAWSPNGQYLATLSYDNVYVWNTVTWNCTFIINHSVSMAWSPDGKYIATQEYSPDSFKIVNVWDTISWTKIFTYQTYQAEYFTSAIAWLPDGEQIASNSSDSGNNAFQGINIWNVTTKKQVADYNIQARVYSIVWSPVGNLCAYFGALNRNKGFGTRALRVWDVQTERNIFSKEVTLLDYPSFLAWSPDGNYLVSNFGSWKIGKGMLIGQPIAKPVPRPIGNYLSSFGLISDLAWSPDGKYIATAHKSKFVVLWNANTGSIILDLCVHSKYVLSLSWSPDGKYIATGSHDQTALVWSVLDAFSSHIPSQI